MTERAVGPGPAVRLGLVRDNGPVTAPTQPPPTRSGPRRWTVILAVGWAVLLVAGIVYAIRTGGPTGRDQTTVAQAQPEVERAIATVATAALADDNAVVAISGFDRVGECSVTLVRGGEQYQQVLIASVAPGTEEALLRRVADRLPGTYGATVRGGSVPRLVADAGYWIRLSASVTSPGRVRFVADTGVCRTVGDLVTPDGGVTDRDTDNTATVRTVFSRLGLVPEQFAAHRVACPGGGSLSTVEAVSRDGTRPGGPLNAGSPNGIVVVSTKDLFAYRDGGTGVSIRADDRSVAVTATTPCP